MTANVTLRVDKRLLKKARHIAVEKDMSLSAWVSHLLEEVVERESIHSSVRERALRRLDKGFHLGGERLNRDMLHER